MSCSAPTSSPETTTSVGEDEGGAITTIAAIHFDVLQAHIFTRLDGPSLASVSCVSSQLYDLSNEESLWRDICHSAWPSTDNPRVCNIVSSFPDGSRSFFSDSFPLLVSQHDPPPSPNHTPPLLPPEIISAVDIHYRGTLLFSKVHETETLGSWFQCSPFRVDLVDPKDMVPTAIRLGDDVCQDLAENLKLSWIMIDPTGRRAANLSSWRPVSVQRHWLSKGIQAKFAMILAGDPGGAREFVLCGIVVTFGGCEEAEMQVKEVSLQVADMDGTSLTGKESLVMLQRAMDGGKRKKGRKEESRERYEEYLRRKKERKESKLRIEARSDSMCMTFCIFIFAFPWMLFFFR
ncbi:PREDICTED: probable F-box protein At1g60180 [Nelumbo nucifera]|uniref:F-box domain-containing protein n=2 Tax=Nelumbo nucifera TaxID=4432 RepID=A0A822Y8R3_NELNU|nr:PREDICTED: probable F-box protein At1g60180 [Nelumbo nucifera]DAD28890.1 TPA_asm: hypothetical protein HUJ06_030358 [Nelumbo nucifera]